MPARLMPKKTSLLSPPMCRVATCRNPESAPARIPAPGRNHLVICACREQSGSGSNGTMPRSYSSRTALPRSLGGKSPLEKWNDLGSAVADCIVLYPCSRAGEHRASSLQSKALFRSVQACAGNRCQHDSSAIEMEQDDGWLRTYLDRG